MTDPTAPAPAAPAPATSGPAATGPSTTVVAVNLVGTSVGAGWGKAHTVAIAQVTDGVVAGWTEHEVAWDALHDESGEGSHHARIVRFCREHGVQVVVTGHMGPPMQNTLTKLGCRLVLGLAGDARTAAVTAAAPGLPTIATAVPDAPGRVGLRSSIVIGTPPGRS